MPLSLSEIILKSILICIIDNLKYCSILIMCFILRIIVFGFTLKCSILHMLNYSFKSIQERRKDIFPYSKMKNVLIKSIFNRL